VKQSLKGMRVCALVSNDTSIDSRVKKECAALAEAGAEVTLVGQSGPKPYPGDVSKLPYELILTRQPEVPRWYARWGRETVFYPLRVAVNLSLEPFRRRLFSVRPWILKAVRGRTFDVIHANDFDMLATGAELARRCGAKLVYDSHEIYLAPGRVIASERYVAQLRERERELVQKVDGFITVNPKIAEYLADLYHTPVDPITIYNGSTTRVTESVPAHKLLRVLFLGTPQPFFNLPRLIPQMERFRGKLELTIQGHSGEIDAVKEAITSSGTADFIHVLPSVDTYSIVDSIKDFDLGLNNMQASNLNEVMSSPNKFFDYLAAGLGSIASKQQVFLSSVVEETGCGYVYDQREPEDLLHAINYLVDHPDEVTAMKRNALAASQQFLWDVQKLKLVELYSSLQEGLS